MKVVVIIFLYCHSLLPKGPSEGFFSKSFFHPIMAPIHRFLGQYVKISHRGELLGIKLQFETVEINIRRRLCPKLPGSLSKILLRAKNGMKLRG